jgi:protein gp37
MASLSTGISWTDATWNVLTGCTPISPGCDRCYAQRLANTRLRHAYKRHLPVIDTEANRADPFAPRFWPDRLRQPLSWKAPRMIFANSMSDVFHAAFSFDVIRQVFEVMNAAHWHTFQVLTKRPERAFRYADRLTWTPNIWIGTSIESINFAARADALRGIDAAPVRFISAEPLLGSLRGLNLDSIDWVIAGGESQPGCRPCDPQWLRELRDDCEEFEIPYFLKQLGGHPDSRSHDKAMLDGRTHTEFPLAVAI